MASMDFLRGEMDRLTNELQLASQEKIQAAEYGLAVLEEKHKLQEQFDDLENSNEATKQELECLKEVSKEYCKCLHIRRPLRALE
jgi:protein bicaudal D